VIPGRPDTRWIACGGLVVLGGAIIGPTLGAPAPATAVACAIALPLPVMVLTGLLRQPRWGIWTAVLMIPYFSVALTDMLTTPGNRWSSAAVATVAVVVFFAAIDVARRSRLPGQR